MSETEPGRSILLATAPVSAAKWRCPSWGYGPDDEPEPEAKECARAVEFLTGCPEGSVTTCPRHIASHPDVFRALRLYRATQTGGVNFDADPPASLIHASELVGSADARRQQREQDDAKTNS